MPLVTRSSTSGNLFVDVTEPPGWLDGELWSDTSQSPPALNINDDGTATGIGGLDIANISARTSTSENVTTTITPAAGEQHTFTVYGESLVATIATVEWSANAGSNFFDPGSLLATLEILRLNGSATLSAPIRINSGSRWRYTTAATTGTYIVVRLGAITS